MSAAIAIRKTADGKVAARRLDGQPMTDADRAEAKALKQKLALESEAPRAWIVQEFQSPAGALAAVEICSALLQDHFILVFELLWFAAPDGAVTYSPDELAALRDKDPATVIKVHETKRAFGGGKVLH